MRRKGEGGWVGGPGRATTHTRGVAVCKAGLQAECRSSLLLSSGTHGTGGHLRKQLGSSGLGIGGGRGLQRGPVPPRPAVAHGWDGGPVEQAGGVRVPRFKRCMAPCTIARIQATHKRSPVQQLLRAAVPA